MKTHTHHSLSFVPLSTVKAIHLHFRFTDLELLPDTVFLDVPQDNKKRQASVVQGSKIITKLSVALPGLFLSLQKHNLISVACTSSWIQGRHVTRDLYGVHFCFVPKHAIDHHQAMFHDVKQAEASFGHLTLQNWNLAIHTNDTKLDINCFCPSKRSGAHSLYVSECALGLS